MTTLTHWFVAHETFSTLSPKQNGCNFADDIFNCIFLNGNIWFALKIPLKFILKGPNNNITTLVQIMVWCRPGDKPLSEPMMVSLLMHKCITLPQWVNAAYTSHHYWIQLTDNFINYCPNAPNIHPLALPWGFCMRCCFWVWSMIYAPPLTNRDSMRLGHA